MDAPFRSGEVVICNLNHFTVKSGDKVRVIRCEHGESETGWLVTATRQTRGRMASNPSIAISGVDSGWFSKVKK